MTSTITDDSKATLLLCGHFFGQRQEGPKPLAQREFNDVARWLSRSSLGPGAFFDAAVRSSFARETGIAESRIDALIGRGGALALAMERWATRGIWVLTRLDPSYPTRLSERLGGSAPVILFGAGPRELLEEGGLAIVGSRKAEDDALDFTRSVAQKSATEGVPVISGAARGIDEEAMTSCLDRGGRALGVLADSLERAVMSRKYRQAITGGRAALISPFHPDAGFNVGNAMGRNASIYALSDAALVVSSDLEEGGTWAGAMNNLKQHYVPLFVRDVAMPGNQGLIRAGAKRWPDDAATIRNVIDGSGRSTEHPVVHQIFDRPAPETLDLLDLVAPRILKVLERETSEKQLAELLGIVPAQARAWLKRLVGDGRIRKLKKPVRYVASTPRLF